MNKQTSKTIEEILENVSVTELRTWLIEASENYKIQSSRTRRDYTQAEWDLKYVNEKYQEKKNEL